MALPTCQVIPPSTTGYRPYCPFTTDPDRRGHWLGPDPAKARSLVDASGTRGEQVVVWTFADFAKEAQYLVGVLDELGYRGRVRVISDTGAYFDTLNRRPDAQAGMYGWFGNPLAVDMLTTLTCTFKPNPAHFCNRRIDAQILQLAQIEPWDPAKARNLAETIDREVTDQAPWVPLFTPQSIDLTSARVGNYQAERGRTLLDQLWVK
jgi:peptide/nickel transport system substrate-binding protein